MGYQKGFPKNLWSAIKFERLNKKLKVLKKEFSQSKGGNDFNFLFDSFYIKLKTDKVWEEGK